MKTDITYGLVLNALIVFVDATAENDKESEVRERYINDVQMDIDSRLKSGENAEDNMMWIDMTPEKFNDVEMMFKRVINTHCIKFAIPFAVCVNRVDPDKIKGEKND